jgi:hypothetical protein
MFCAFGVNLGGCPANQLTKEYWTKNVFLDIGDGTFECYNVKLVFKATCPLNSGLEPAKQTGKSKILHTIPQLGTLKIEEPK